ncbi:hypothetical protein IEQ34_023030 [Dendrobium chrysotoxum]|uniref:Uncharacterized protein n=1 Tax=Dendrobium chrysotoxum TaxID=161865 RepID=A0AAV7FZ32_DENCH|nr:hypothetical protein IEQ34_023030 [Dendrobium chrysotoxum]
MESFSLLRYWRGGTSEFSLAANMPATEAMTLLEPTVDDETIDDEGPYFDLDFSNPKDRSTEERGRDHEEDEQLEDREDEKDFDFSLNSSDGSNIQTISTSDDIFFKGKLIP